MAKLYVWKAYHPLVEITSTKLKSSTDAYNHFLVDKDVIEMCVIPGETFDKVYILAAE